MGKYSHFETIRKVPASVLEQALNVHIQRLRSESQKSVASFFAGGALEDLSLFAKRNTVVGGCLLHKILNDIFGLKLDSSDEMKIPFKCSVLVNFSIEKKSDTTMVAHGKERRVSTHQTNQKSGRIVEDTEWTCYGVDFDLNIKWTFRNTDGHEKIVHFFERVIVAPQAHERCPIQVKVPPSTEFYIGKAIDMAHSMTEISHDDFASGKSHYLCDNHDWVDCDKFPRHNPIVQEIEKALAEVSKFVDMHTRFLSPYTRAVNAHETNVAIPWSTCRLLVKDQHLLLDKEVSGMMAKFHNDRMSEIIGAQGVMCNLYQCLHILKLYAVHIGNCYEEIDHVMVRSFLKGIGTKNATIFEESKSLDNMLMRISNHQFESSRMPFLPIGIELPDASIELKVKLPDTEYYQTIMGLTKSDAKFEGGLHFGSIGNSGVKVFGHMKRQIFVLPTAPGGHHNEMAKLCLEGNCNFSTEPIAVIVGSAKVRDVSALAVFMFKDSINFKAAIDAASIPSNKAFGESMAVVTDEMESFASAIRECDIAHSGISIDVIKLRPLLARAVGCPEKFLAGSRENVDRMINVINAGGSLHRLSQSITDENCGQEEWTHVENGAYDMQKFEAELKLLEDDMRKQGQNDHPDPVPTTNPTSYQDDLDTYEQQCVYRGSGGMARFRSLSAQQEPVPIVAQNQGGDEDSNMDDSEDTDTSKGSNFMNTILKRLECIENEKSVMGCKLSIPNPSKAITFAKSLQPKVWPGYEEHPAPEDYKSRDLRLGNKNALVQLIKGYGDPVRTNRVVIYGVLTCWESNVLLSLMQGKKDPTKLALEVARALDNL